MIIGLMSQDTNRPVRLFLYSVSHSSYSYITWMHVDRLKLKIDGELNSTKKRKKGGDILIIFPKSIIYGYIIYPKFPRHGEQVTRL